MTQENQDQLNTEQTVEVLKAEEAPQRPYQQPYQSAQQTQTVNVIMVARKSVGVAIVLSFFFGPLGMFYSTVVGAIVMIIVSTIVGILTLGLGLLITQPICIIWAAVAASNQNKVVS